MGAGLLLAGIWYLAGPKAEDKPASSAFRLPSRPLLTPWAGTTGGGLTLFGAL